MPYNKNVYRRVAEEFSHKHRDRIDEAEGRRIEIEAKFPEIAEINLAMRKTGMKVYEATLLGKEGLDERIAKVRKENEQLQETRREALRYHGYPEDYLEVHYDCPKCEDQGSIGLRMCECMKNALIDAGYDESGLSSLFRESTFDGFDLSQFGAGSPEYESMSGNLKICREYANGFTTDSDIVAGGSKNLFLYGDTGLGKTYLSSAIAGRLIERGYDVVYDTAVNLFSAFEAEHFGKGKYSDNNGESETGRYFDCDVLLIDDLGTEMKSQFTVSMLYNLLNTRLNRRKAIIISTNLKMQKPKQQKESNEFADVRSRYDDRIYSRILGEFRILPFVGKDYRLIKLNK